MLDNKIFKKMQFNYTFKNRNGILVTAKIGATSVYWIYYFGGLQAKDTNVE